MTARIVVCLVLIIICQMAHATKLQDPRIESVINQLSAPDTLVGLFTQRRQIAAFDATLISKGEFYFWRNHGIYWATLEPIENKITYRTDKTLQWLEGEASPNELKSRSNQHFRRMLLAIFSFDQAILDEIFQQDWRFDNRVLKGRNLQGQDFQDEDQHFETNSWQLILTPHKGPAQRFLESVVLWGDAYVERMQLSQSNGEIIDIRFRLESSPSKSNDVKATPGASHPSLVTCTSAFGYSPGECVTLIEKAHH